MIQIAIIGFGKLGSHLYHSLIRTRKFEVRPVIRHSSTKMDAKDFNKCRTIFICTEDSAIASTAASMLEKKIDLKDKYIFHTSGAHSSDLLLPLKKAGAFIGSFHPVQTFDSTASRFSGRFKNIYIVLEGSPGCIHEGRSIAKALGSRVLELSRENKVLHHICCVFASNYLASHFSQVEKISRIIRKMDQSKKRLKNGFNNLNFFDIYKPLTEQTLNNIREKGIINSLTGPIERNDTVTVQLHLETLAKDLREVLPFYVLMGIEAIELAVRKKSLNQFEANKLMELMNRYM